MHHYRASGFAIHQVKSSNKRASPITSLVLVAYNRIKKWYGGLLYQHHYDALYINNRRNLTL